MMLYKTAFFIRNKHVKFGIMVIQENLVDDHVSNSKRSREDFEKYFYSLYNFQHSLLFLSSIKFNYAKITFWELWRIFEICSVVLWVVRLDLFPYECGQSERRERTGRDEFWYTKQKYHISDMHTTIRASTLYQIEQVFREFGLYLNRSKGTLLMKDRALLWLTNIQNILELATVRQKSVEA